jgi:hypothetical protein
VKDEYLGMMMIEAHEHSRGCVFPNVRLLIVFMVAECELAESGVIG